MSVGYAWHNRLNTDCKELSTITQFYIVSESVCLIVSYNHYYCGFPHSNFKDPITQLH